MDTAIQTIQTTGAVLTLNNITLYLSVRLYNKKTSTHGLEYGQGAFPPRHKGALVTTTVTGMRAAESNGYVHLIHFFAFVAR